ncbi:MAG: 30S ribosomal protein S8 [Mycoplasma sp.]
MHTDPIAELLTKIRNAKKVYKPSITVQTSNIKTAILEVLKREGYIKDFSVTEEDKKSFTEVKLKYKNKASAIHGLRQISKPGLRVYSESTKLPKVLNGLGVALISTSKGVMTDKEARTNNIGGEIIAYVW